MKLLFWLGMIVLAYFCPILALLIILLVSD